MKVLSKAHYQNYEQKCLEKIFQSMQGKTCLDYGCGKGKYLEIMKKNNIDCVGIDINCEQVTTLKQSGYCVYTDISSVLHLQFDCILLSHIIEHLDYQELMLLFEQLLPLLKDTGKLIIVTPTFGEHFFYDFTHIRPYYPQSIRMLFGGIDTAQSCKLQNSLELEDIYFFRDSYRFRLFSAFYPTSHAPLFFKRVLQLANVFLAYCHVLTHGKFGKVASWLGIYGKRV